MRSWSGREARTRSPSRFNDVRSDLVQEGLQPGRVLGVRGRRRDDRVGAAQHPVLQRRVQAQRARLVDDVAVPVDDDPGLAPRQPQREVGHRVGQMDVDDVVVRVRSQEASHQRRRHRRRQQFSQRAGTFDRVAVAAFDDGAPAQVGAQHVGAQAAGVQAFGQSERRRFRLPPCTVRMPTSRTGGSARMDGLGRRGRVFRSGASRARQAAKVNRGCRTDSRSVPECLGRACQARGGRGRP